jgi:demethylmenaquinone methyltransferase / 2-methoxy-6-polyprenyl-1,4-benzoquinol methylase
MEKSFSFPLALWFNPKINEYFSFMSDTLFPNQSIPEKVSFGFQDVSKPEKKGLVQGVFSSVARKYDLMNDVMSMGVHRLWKQAMIAWLAPRPHMKFLDVAGGTGDIALRILDSVKDKAEVTVCDLTYAMLHEGKKRSQERPLIPICGNAESLPFPDNTFDAYTIAFGIRNVTTIDLALKEAYRVLKPRGRFLCLEFSQVVLPVLDQIYDQYSFNLIPWLGEKIANDRDSYQYLVESIRKFPPQPAFLQKIKNAGFEQAKYRNLTGGIAALHSGWKI